MIQNHGREENNNKTNPNIKNMIIAGIYDNILGGPNSQYPRMNIFDNSLKQYARKLNRIDKIKKIISIFAEQK